MSEPSLALHIFASGNVTITGAKNREDINVAFDNIFPKL